MAVLNHDEQPGSGGLGKILAIGAAVVILLVAAYFGATMIMKPAPAPKEAPVQTKTEPPPRVAPRPVEPEPEPETPKITKPRPKKERPVEAAPAPPPPPAAPVLVVESDVPGASVFVDRKYVGATPLRTTEVTPGSHQLNASATGEEGLAQSIDVGETGETSIALKFHEVRLNAAVAVVHKHGMGSCDGRLVATPSAISYQTANKKDAFSFPLRDLDVFEIDYLKKELKVKQRGGKTWNFTDKSENADKLFVFHRDVTKAREKMAAQAR
ncbi:MAG: PEGA domain-containing protein [Acidobacteria bacterium]|nr:PEGA domain-containing protein [Acidobacteriota bacterium]